MHKDFYIVSYLIHQYTEKHRICLIRGVLGVIALLVSIILSIFKSISATVYILKQPTFYS